MTENQYQTKLIKKLYKKFPGCVIQKMDPSYQQGMPDLLILWKDTWAALEVKATLSSFSQPNQDYYIDILDGMSFAAYICPENEREVLSALQQAFESPRRACVS